jgi:hypothetical protein
MVLSGIDSLADARVGHGMPFRLPCHVILQQLRWKAARQFSDVYIGCRSAMRGL